MLTWIAIYNDGTTLPQYNADGTENKYTDIDRGRLSKFCLVDPTTGNPRVILNIDPARGQKLVYRLRTAINLAGERKRMHIIGWQMPGIQNISFLSEEGDVIEITNGFREDHRFYYPVIFLPEEEI